MTILGKQVEPIIDAALAEDLGLGDVTTEALIPVEMKGKAHLIAKGEGVLAGIGIAAMVFRRLDPDLVVRELVADGSRLRLGDKLATVEGRVASILRAERVALNFVQRLSGIATETARYVEAIAGTKRVIMDTRKTTPGLRMLEKYAVRVGGGHNHRLSLSDGIIIKDNHQKALRSCGMELGEAIRRVREHAPITLKVEVEAQSVQQALEAIAGKADIIMLDNMSIDDISRVVELAEGRVPLEVSGGISLVNISSVAEVDVDLISVGALTHSATALDMSLDLDM
ncbi:MAG: carboxylating nicotinate-nucleotide diphosphorylase [Dehalococcoidia bacterium]